MHVRFAAAALALAGLLAVSCGGVTDPSQNVQDTWSGTLQPQSSAAKSFNVSNGGEFSVKITQLLPNPTSVVGMIWGLTQGDGSCSLIQQNNFATLNTPALAGAVLTKGNYCVAIYDIGTLSVAQNFTIVVSHP